MRLVPFYLSSVKSYLRLPPLVELNDPLAESWVLSARPFGPVTAFPALVPVPDRVHGDTTRGAGGLRTVVRVVHAARVFRLSGVGVMIPA